MLIIRLDQVPLYSDLNGVSLVFHEGATAMAGVRCEIAAWWGLQLQQYDR